MSEIGTSGHFRSTSESETMLFTAAATTSKHLLRSSIAAGVELLFLPLDSVSSIPLLLYPTANYQRLL